jgi:hypothetical protein
MILYLPRIYEKVVGIRIKGAEFPPITSFWAHDYGSTGPTSSNDYALPLNGLLSFNMDIENLNRSDETALGHQRSSFTDSTFAKFQLPAVNTDPVIHNESSSIHNEAYYTPPIAKLDRLHIVLRTHRQKVDIKRGSNTAGSGYIYSSGGKAPVANQEYGLTLEIETLENSFDDFSSVETRISERNGGFWNNA